MLTFSYALFEFEMTITMTIKVAKAGYGLKNRLRNFFLFYYM